MALEDGRQCAGWSQGFGWQNPQAFYQGAVGPVLNAWGPDVGWSALAQAPNGPSILNWTLLHCFLIVPMQLLAPLRSLCKPIDPGGGRLDA